MRMTIAHYLNRGATERDVRSVLANQRLMSPAQARSAQESWGQLWLEAERPAIPRDLRAFVAKRGNWRCHYCPAVLTPATLTIDHVVPWSRGGPTTAANLVPACERCNRRKGHRDAEDFIAELRLIATGPAA